MNSSLTEESDLKIFDLNTAKIFLRQDGIICIHIKDDVDIQLADAMEHFESLRYLAGGKKYPVLVLTGNGGTVDNQVKDFYRSKKANEPTLAEAVLAKSLAHKLIVNFLIKFNKPDRPIRMFTDEEEAVEWLNR